MVIDLKMCRFENVPWGFRLIGGSDFEIPLTVVKVTEGSIADLAGMKSGDIIVRINDDATTQLSHNDAHEVIKNAGNNFFFVIHREEEEPEINNTQVNQQNLTNPSDTPVLEDIESNSNATFERNSNAEQSCASEEKLSDEEIAELISGEAEVLKDHNVIGVNFNRIFPKPGVCMSSQVLRQLNDEAMKTKIEREQEKRKWTTFMQKPDRPIPKSKKELEEEKEKEINAYKVVITKQPKPKVAPDHIPTPPRTPDLVPSPIIEDVNIELETEAKPLTDSELPDLEIVDCYESEEHESEYCAEFEELADKNVKNSPDVDELKISEKSLEPETLVIEKTEEELILEQQLADVQKQLLALSSLPSTIQATLDAVTKQLAELLPTFKLQAVTNQQEKSENKNEFIEAGVEIVDNENKIVKQFDKELNCIAVDRNEVNEDNNKIVETETSMMKEGENLIEKIESEKLSESTTEEIEIIESENLAESTAEEIEYDKWEYEEEKAKEELNYKKQKDNDLMIELQQRLTKERIQNRPAKPFGPLVPQQRPLILPGGRRWRTPKDAFNEDFIAETLSSQAELIVGHTLGSTFESPLLGYDRVNFLKYQKPEKKIDLEKSEVYKVVHHLERLPKHGIEMRPPKVLAEEDIRKGVNTPISCG